MNEPSTAAGSRFVQIADVHYEAADGPVPPLAQMGEHIPENNRVTTFADRLLISALEFCTTDLDPGFIVFTGDQVDEGEDEAGRKNQDGFRECVQRHTDDTPVRYLFGNHDRPRERYLELYGDSIYRFEQGGCHFAVLDSGLMEGEEDPEIIESGLQVLEQTLRQAGGAPVAVLCHFYLEPSGIPGYSYRAAEEAIELLEEYPGPVCVINGHFHHGRVIVRRCIPYFTAEAFVEPPVRLYLHELSPQSLRIVQYTLEPETGEWSGFEKFSFDLSGLKDTNREGRV